MTAVAPVPFGVVEGFFGKPWPDAARLDTLRFLGAQGFCHYIYAPKADRYLRRAWREPMPAETLSRIATLAAQCRTIGMRFGVGLAPYEIHLDYSADAMADLRRKVLQLNQLSVDLLCILFDDMRGGGRLAEVQARVVGDVAGWSTATAFIVCPTYYSDDPILEKVFGPAPRYYLETLGRTLDPAIDVFWTGEKVCSSRYSDAHLEDIAGRLGRKPFIWDNRLANDGRVRCTHLYLNPFDERWSLNTTLVAGVAVNPMNQPNVSRVPLATYAGRLCNGETLSDDASFRAQVLSVCGAPLGAEILGDHKLLQYAGVSRLDERTRASLIEKYRRFEPNAVALEIVAWLGGQYDFDPNCLTE